MQLFKSLICAQGRDNRQRFLAIHLAIYLILIVTAQIGAGGLTLLMTVGLSSLSGLATVRRLRDAEKPLPWAGGQILLIAVSCLLIAFGDHPSRYLILLLSFFATFALSLPLARYPGRYTQGYQGPVSLDSAGRPGARDRAYAERIEPTLAMASGDIPAAADPGINPDLAQPIGTAPSDSQSMPPRQTAETAAMDPLAPLLRWYGQHQRLSLAIIAGVSLAIIAAVTLPMMTDEPAPTMAEAEAPPAEPAPVETLVEHELAMPDSYWLLLNNHQGLTLQWQADEAEQPLLWSQATAEGDMSCQAITFNNGDKIRTLEVTVEDGIDYHASFSPLDTALIIEGLAMRGSFKLCGYDFSLKGSQRALNSNPTFARFLE